MPPTSSIKGYASPHFERLFAGILLSSALVLANGASARAQSSFGPNPQPVSDSSALPDAPLPQTADPAPAGLDRKPNVTLRTTPVNILKDQAAIWTSPARMREHDVALLVPLVIATALTITVDHQVMSSARLDDASLNNHADTASNGLVGGFVAAPAIIYGLGQIHHDDHATETGLLAGESIVDSIVVSEVLKAASARERPTVDGAKGRFFQSGVGLGSAFPSNHSVIAWSSAAVIASEYNGPMTQIAAYGLATGVSLARVLARQHFPSDVLVGSAVGWMVGRYVYRKHGRNANTAGPNSR